MADQASGAHYIHRYHATATALEGFIQSPFEQAIPPQLSISVEPKGGYFSLRAEKFRFEEIVSFTGAHTQVSGAPNRKPQKKGNPTTLASAVVEGLHVRDVLSCDRVVAQITTDHPANGGTPTVSFLGTRFENLRIGGKHIEVSLGLDLCDQDEKNPAKSCINNPKFLANIKDKYYERGGDEKNPSVLCSLVKDIGGKPNHVLDVPEFGKVFLAELTVEEMTYRLTMIRIELGCAVYGSTSISRTVVNGGGSGG